MARLSTTEFVTIDTETTGSDPSQAEVIEIAVRRFSLGSNPVLEDHWDTLVRPTHPIPPVASAVHHLTDEDVADCPTLAEVVPTLHDFVGTSILIAHNADYDKTVLGPAGLTNPWFDTYRLAMRLWAVGDVNDKGFALGSFAQQELRYWLGLPRTQGDAHRAAADIEVTAHLFRAAVHRYLNAGMPDDVEAFGAWLNSPIIHRTIPFGYNMAGKQPEDLEDWQLRKAFDPTSDKYEAFKKFNVHAFLYPYWSIRSGLSRQPESPPVVIPPPAPVPVLENEPSTPAGHGAGFRSRTRGLS